MSQIAIGLTFGAPLYLVSALTEELVDDLSPLIKKTVAASGLVLMGSSVFISLGSYGRAFVLGIGAGVFFGAVNPPKANAKFRALMTLPKMPPYNPPTPTYHLITDCSGKVSYEWR